MRFDSTHTPEQLVDSVAKKLEAADLYFGHGTDNAWDEACWLVESLLRKHGLPVEEELSDAADGFFAELQAMLARRIQERIPTAYLLQEAWFAGLPFYVDERVLIPRSPMAELIESGFSTLLSAEPRSILDLCTGSGCIGIAAAMYHPEARVLLSDLSADALDVAQINIQKHGVAARVSSLRSDLFTDIQGAFDLILCNPPYVGSSEYESLPSEYLKEPAQGLLSENDGLAIPLAVMRQAADYLNEEGCLILELGNSWELLDQLLVGQSLLWLDFEHGGHGVCAIKTEQLRQLQPLLQSLPAP